MPAQAVQLPAIKEPVDRTGKRLFRVQALPVGKVEHPKHGELDFSRDTLEQLVEAFRAGAMDQVPFLIEDKDGGHTTDPERFRGEVKGLDLAGDGMYATVEMTDRGADLLAENPRLPVSVRLVTEETGRFKGRQVLNHLLGTLDPVIKGMKSWQVVDASRELEVTDFSSGKFVPSDGKPQDSAISTDADTQGKDALLTEDERGVFKTLFDKVIGGGKSDDAPPPAASDDPSKTDERAKTDEEPVLSDDEYEKLLKDFNLEDAGEPAADEEKDKEPVAAALSDEDRQTLDMATTRIRKADLRAGKSELERKFDGYLKAGVPPAQIDAAREKLLRADDLVIDFANDKTSVALDATFAALDAAKGTIDFSERGSSLGSETEDEDAAKERRETAEKAAEGWA